MDYILDTHVLLWFLNNDSRISENAKIIIKNSKNNIYLSSAVVWEISIKLKIGRISFKTDLNAFIPECMRVYNFTPLSITIPHALRVSYLQEIHRDPFDRILIAQSQVTGYPIITSDGNIKKYNVKTIW